MKTNLFITTLIFVLFSCGNNDNGNKNTNNKIVITAKDSTKKAPNSSNQNKVFSCKNDSLDVLAKVIAGINDTSRKILKDVFEQTTFKKFSNNFTKKWNQLDSSRLKKLEVFRATELTKTIGETETLFYPFSGPDFLYSNAFFPEATNYILMGLEPVGSIPIYNQTDKSKDSLNKYFEKINSSLYAILKFSFFRTASMSHDLHTQELDGTLHLLLLFIKRTGHNICSAKPIYIDSSGSIKYLNSFPELAKKSLNNRGVEIVFTNKSGQQKRLYYYSLHLEDGSLRNNKGVNLFFAKMGNFNTYLKGASYLMHQGYFSHIRNVIFEHSKNITQDDSGIALRYFENSGYKWEYNFYGKYTRPISLFSYAYQKDLDSLYRTKGSKEIGFGIGYNFQDKNSNLMIAKRGNKIDGYIPKVLSKSKEKEKIETN